MKLTELLTESEADELILIQSEISIEIQEEITILSQEGLMEKKLARRRGFMVCIVKGSNGKLAGYGHGYRNFDNDFYIDTIGVTRKERGKGIGTEIKQKLIQYAFNTLNLDRVKAITQTSNIETISINEKLGFKAVVKNDNKL